MINKNICINCRFFIKESYGVCFYRCSLPNMFRSECPQLSAETVNLYEQMQRISNKEITIPMICSLLDKSFEEYQSDLKSLVNAGLVIWKRGIIKLTGYE